MISATTRWRSELAVWLAVAAAVTAAFWIGGGPRAGVIAGAGSVVGVVGLHFGRRRFDALRILGGVGDERVRHLYTRATATAGTVLWLVTTMWWLITLIRGEHDLVLLVLVLVFSFSFLASAVHHALRS